MELTSLFLILAFLKRCHDKAFSKKNGRLGKSERIPNLKLVSFYFPSTKPTLFLYRDQ